MKQILCLLLALVASLCFALSPCSGYFHEPVIDGQNVSFKFEPVYNGLDFDGVNDYVEVEHHPELNFGDSQDFTIQAWIKLREFGQNNPIVSKIVQTGSQYTGYQFWIAPDNKVKGDVCFSSSYRIAASSSTITDTLWHHVAFVADRDGNEQIYIDGSPNGAPVNIAGTGDTDNSANLNIGRTPHKPENAFNGKIATVKISEKALNSSDIYDSFLRDGYFVNDSFTLALWKLVETIGSTAYDETDIHHGTIFNDETNVIALTFDGTDDFIEVEHHPELNFGASQDFTIQAWIKLREFGQNNPIVSKIVQTGSQYTGYQFWIAPDNKVKGDVCFSSSYRIAASSSTITDTLWHHVAFVADRDGNEQIYIDGSPNGAPVNIAGTGDTDNYANLNIGRTSHKHQNAFNGDIASVKISNSALEAIDVANSYNLSGNFDLDTNTIALWNLEEGAGTTAIDQTGNHDANIYQGQAYSNAFSFDGIDDFIEVEHHPELNFGANQDFTIQAWIKLREFGQNNPIVSKIVQTGSQYTGYQFWIAPDNKVKGDVCFSSSYRIAASSSTITDTLWHHVAFVADRDGNEQIYIDGSPNGAPVNIAGTGDTDNSANINIGRTPHKPENAFEGDFAAVKISTVPLTDEQIAASYIAGGDFTLDSTTIALWNLNEPTGTTAFDETGAHNGTVADSIVISSIAPPLDPIPGASWALEATPGIPDTGANWFTSPALTYTWDIDGNGISDTITSADSLSWRYEESGSLLAKVSVSDGDCVFGDSVWVFVESEGFEFNFDTLFNTDDFTGKELDNVFLYYNRFNSCFIGYYIDTLTNNYGVNQKQFFLINDRGEIDSVNHNLYDDERILFPGSFFTEYHYSLSIDSIGTLSFEDYSVDSIIVNSMFDERTWSYYGNIDIINISDYGYALLKVIDDSTGQLSYRIFNQEKQLSILDSVFIRSIISSPSGQFIGLRKDSQIQIYDSTMTFIYETGHLNLPDWTSKNNSFRYNQLPYFLDDTGRLYTLEKFDNNWIIGMHNQRVYLADTINMPEDYFSSEYFIQDDVIFTTYSYFNETESNLLNRLVLYRTGDSLMKIFDVNIDFEPRKVSILEDGFLILANNLQNKLNVYELSTMEIIAEREIDFWTLYRNKLMIYQDPSFLSLRIGGSE
ncbi:MAG: LamG domain-containing protein [Candidatus Zixiibacteriota bacterium]